MEQGWGSKDCEEGQCTNEGVVGPVAIRHDLDKSHRASAAVEGFELESRRPYHS